MEVGPYFISNFNNLLDLNIFIEEKSNEFSNWQFRFENIDFLTFWGSFAIFWCFQANVTCICTNVLLLCKILYLEFVTPNTPGVPINVLIYEAPKLKFSQFSRFENFGLNRLNFHTFKTYFIFHIFFYFLRYTEPSNQQYFPIS